MIITQTPLRVSFAGGGTDFPEYYASRGGYVVNAAIDKFAFVIVTARYDEKIKVNYSQRELVDRVDDIQHELVREAMRLTGMGPGVEVTLLADIPSEGSGLGSSSSFTVGLLNAFHVYRGDQVGPGQLAEEACEIELQRCGKPIGKQDQYIAAFGGVCAIRFAGNDPVDVERVRLSDNQFRRFSTNLFLFYTDRTRKAEDVLREQRDRTEQNQSHLDEIKALAVETRGCLGSGEFDRIGEILDSNWQIKKQLASQITNSRLDEMYDLARRHGATGGKVCGAGGGGFLLVYCPAASHQQLLSGMAAYRQMPFLIESDGSKVIFNYRRPSWK